ncbi:MAG: aminopeptidase [Phycisphaerales bacterium JB065]
MRDPRLDRLADVIVTYSTKVKAGDLVGIRSDPVAMPLIEAVYEKCLKVGAYPFWEATADCLNEIYLEHADEKQLGYLNPLQMQSIETMDVRLVFWAETNTKAMSQINPGKQRIQSAARKPYMKRFLERVAASELRWCGTLFPTQASAQDAEMSLRQYEDFVFRAGLLHLDDPAAAWEKLSEGQQRAVDWLNTKKLIHFKAPAGNGHDGTDLRVSVDGATWINCCGGDNFPDGEVFAGPQGVDGHVNYTFPAVYNGREVEGIRLAFKGGRVVDASARRNEEFLIAMLDQDEGARNLGEIAIGTNYSIKQYTKNTLFDEKIGGTFHAAVGAGYPESGNTNESGLHWDMVCDLRPEAGGGSITADGEEFFRDGRFLFEGWPSPD